MIVVERGIQYWLEMPLWAKWASAIALVLSIDATSMAWGDRRPVGAFFEAFLALVLYWGTAFGVLAAGIWSGVKVAERTRSKLAGWAAGISLYVVAGSAIFLVADHVPGVGWRIDQLLNRDGDF